MAKRKSDHVRMIGLFVLGGILLLVGGIATFASMELFSRRMQFVMYFDSSLNGLDIGSPVSFRGVDIGQVTNIVMELDRTRQEVTTPVYVEIDPSRFKVSSFTDQLSLLAEPPIKRMVEKGLRAQLQTQSWITGQMYIELEFHPSYPAKWRAGEEIGVDEIPTIPSQFDQVQATLSTVLEKVRALDLEGLIETSVDTMETTNKAVNEFYEVTHKINQHIESILVNVDATSQEGKVAMARARETMKSLEATAKRLDEMMLAITPGVTQGVGEAQSAFEEMAKAMQALKELSELLERNPDALLTGKQDRSYR